MDYISTVLIISRYMDQRLPTNVLHNDGDLLTRQGIHSFRRLSKPHHVTSNNTLRVSRNISSTGEVQLTVRLRLLASFSPRVNNLAGSTKGIQYDDHVNNLVINLFFQKVFFILYFFFRLLELSRNISLSKNIYVNFKIRKLYQI